MITKILGLLVMFVALLGLYVGVFEPSDRRRRIPIIGWSVIAFATGAAVQWFPHQGIASMGTVVGFLLVGHGLTATSMTLRYWRTFGVARIAVGLVGLLLLFVGLALVSARDVQIQLDRAIVGVDIVLFGASLIMSRLLIEASDRANRRSLRRPIAPEAPTG